MVTRQSKSKHIKSDNTCLARGGVHSGLDGSCHIVGSDQVFWWCAWLYRIGRRHDIAICAKHIIVMSHVIADVLRTTLGQQGLDAQPAVEDQL